MNDIQKSPGIDVGAGSREEPGGRRPGGSVTQPPPPATKTKGLGGGRILALARWRCFPELWRSASGSTTSCMLK
jgi:hypothetical protein